QAVVVCAARIELERAVPGVDNFAGIAKRFAAVRGRKQLLKAVRVIAEPQLIRLQMRGNVDGLGMGHLDVGVVEVPQIVDGAQTGEDCDDRHNDHDFQERECGSGRLSACKSGLHHVNNSSQETVSPNGQSYG